MPEEVTPPTPTTPATPATPKKRSRALSPKNFAKQLERKTTQLIDDAIEQAKKGKPALLRILLQLVPNEAQPGEPGQQPTEKTHAAVEWDIDRKPPPES